jgi:hypothetical protein
MVDALQGIQSLLLTKKLQDLLSQNAYRLQNRNPEMNVVNIGPIFYQLIIPEMTTVAQYVSRSRLKIGEEYSSDVPRQSAAGEQPVARTNIKLIFDKFNSRAANWADKPISAFPINVNSLFAHLRAEREVGQFSSTINNFISLINQLVNETSNYILERNANSDEPAYFLERPQIKYTFYPDPEDPSAWIMYVFDAKYPLVKFRQLTAALVEGANSNRPLTKAETIERLEQLEIPWMEIGEGGGRRTGGASIIKSISARTIADDLLLTSNMIAANQRMVGTRDIDGSVRIPPGISREFLAGAQLDPQNVIRSTTLIMPIQVEVTTLFIASAMIFSPIYLFLPTPQFS